MQARAPEVFESAHDVRVEQNDVLQAVPVQVHDRNGVGAVAVFQAGVWALREGAAAILVDAVRASDRREDEVWEVVVGDVHSRDAPAHDVVEAGLQGLRGGEGLEVDAHRSGDVLVGSLPDFGALGHVEIQHGDVVQRLIERSRRKGDEPSGEDEGYEQRLHRAKLPEQLALA